jgi:hypothetical protein
LISAARPSVKCRLKSQLRGRSRGRWIVTAWEAGEPVAATTYRIAGYGGVMAAGDLLAVSPLGRALLLQFFAMHDRRPLPHRYLRARRPVGVA